MPNTMRNTLTLKSNYRANVNTIHAALKLWHFAMEQGTQGGAVVIPSDEMRALAEIANQNGELTLAGLESLIALVEKQ